MIRVVAVALILAIALAGCAGDGGRADAAATTIAPSTSGVAPPAATPSFADHHGDGFSLVAPDTWGVDADEAGRVVVTGDAGERIVLVPLFAQGSLAAAAAAAILDRVADDALDAAWRAPETLADRVVRMVGTVDGGTAVAMLAWVSSESGSAGFASVASAPDWDAAAPVLAGVLDSFSVTGPPLGRAATPPFVTWRDPSEGAFTVDVPAGWTASGGMVRPCPIILQGAVEVRSPDGIYLKYGSDYPYFVDEAAGAQFGLGVGDTWPQSCGYQSPVAPYAPGAQFVLDHLAPQVPGVEILDVRDRADLAGQLASAGLTSYDAGEVEYRYEDDGVARRGIVLAITEHTTLGGVGTWDVWRIVIAEGPVTHYDDAVAAGTRLAESFAFDPTWAQAQAQLTAAQSQILAEMSDAISRTMSEGYWGRQAVMDAIFERQSMATLGVEDYLDPVTGTTYRLDTGPSHYWVDPSGTIVGTDTSAAPDVDFREIIQVPS